MAAVVHWNGQAYTNENLAADAIVADWVNRKRGEGDSDFEGMEDSELAEEIRTQGKEIPVSGEALQKALERLRQRD